MDFVMLIVMAILFAVLTPGVLLYLPPKSSLAVAAVTHGIVFALVWHFVHKPIAQMIM
jgi:hypothetical protein